MWILEVQLWHRLFVDTIPGVKNMTSTKVEKVIDAGGDGKVAVLPFRYQFAAGAVAGISEASFTVQRRGRNRTDY
jgi:hypothetical protein